MDADSGVESHSSDNINLTLNPDPKPPPFRPLPTNEIVTPQVVRDIFQKFDPSLEVIEFTAEPGTNHGDNFLSLVYAVQVKVHRGQSSESSLSTVEVMLKAIPRNPIRLRIVQEGKYFLKETIMYNVVLPLLTANTDYGSFPRALAAFYDGNDDGYIAMENLKVQGYSMVPRNQWLDLVHARLAITELAKFHALSFAQWRGDGGLILEAFPDIQETLWLEPNTVSDLTQTYVRNTFPDLRALLERGGHPEEGLKMTQHTQNMFTRMFELSSVPAEYPSVVNHGDPWNNNMLFGYRDPSNPGQPTEVKLVDFQASKVGSRMTDLSYFLFISLQNSVLNENLEELLEAYHSTFLQYLRDEFGFKGRILFGEQELSWDFFLQEWEVYKYYGLSMALIFLPCMCADPKSIPDMETMGMEDFERKDQSEDNKFAEFMNVEHTLPKILNLARFHLPA